MLSNHLILCLLLLVLPPILPSLSLFQSVHSLHQVARVLELQHQSFQWIFRIDFLSDWLIWFPCSTKDRLIWNNSSFWILARQASLVLQQLLLFLKSKNPLYLALSLQSRDTQAVAIWHSVSHPVHGAPSDFWDRILRKPIGWKSQEKSSRAPRG